LASGESTEKRNSVHSKVAMLLKKMTLMGNQDIYKLEEHTVYLAVKSEQKKSSG